MLARNSPEWARFSAINYARTAAFSRRPGPAGPVLDIDVQGADNKAGSEAVSSSFLAPSRRFLERRSCRGEDRET